MQAQGGAAIGQGLASAGKSIGAGITQERERKDKMAERDRLLKEQQNAMTGRVKQGVAFAKVIGSLDLPEGVKSMFENYSTIANDPNISLAEQASAADAFLSQAPTIITLGLNEAKRQTDLRNAQQAARISGLYRQGDGRMLSMFNESSFDPVALEQGRSAYLRDALTESQIEENLAQARGAGAPKPPSDVGTIPQGYRAVRNNIGQVISLEPIPGFTPDTSETDLRKMQIAEAKRKEAADEEAKKRKQEQYNFRVVNQYNSAQNVIDQIDESIEMANAVGSTGLIGATVALVPGTPQFDLSQKLSTILANIGFDRLQQMREESPTGGALGQVAVQELVALQNSIASLSQKQSGEQLAANLKRVKQKYSTFATALEKDFNKIPKDPSQMTEEEILQELGGRK
jgi:hypothetical protein